MSVRIQHITAPLDPAGSSSNARTAEAVGIARQRQGPGRTAQPDITRLTGGSPAAGSAGTERNRRSRDTTGAGTPRAGPVSSTVSVPQESGLQQNIRALSGAEVVMGSIAESIPAASDAVGSALSQQFDGVAKYASLKQELGPDWISSIDVVVDDSHSPRFPGSQFKITYVDPVTGDISVPHALNDVDTKKELATFFVQRVKDHYKAGQDTFWSGTTNGTERSKVLQETMRAALQAEAGIRVATSTLSLKAYLITREVWERGRLLPADATPDQSLRPGQAGTNVSRLTLHGENVPGAFVFTQHGAAWQDGVAVLWRPGRPLQEFESMHQLRGWVAAEQMNDTPGRIGAGIDAVGTTAASGDTFALRMQDLRAHMSGALDDAVEEKSIYAMKEYLDQATDPAPYLDLSPAWDGDVTERLRADVSGRTAPAQMIQWEQARQTALHSSQRLESEIEAIPDLTTFARRKVIEQLAKDHPGTRAVDPDRTIVHTNVVTTTVHPLYKTSTTTTRHQSYSLTDYALRNAPEWQGPTITEHSSAALLDERGEPLVDQDGNSISLDTHAVESLATTLDVGKQYTDMLLDTLSSSGSARQRALQALWMAAASDKMQAERLATALDPAALETLQWQAAEAPTLRRALSYIDAVIRHPDPETRPTVDGHRIVANSLTLGAANRNGGGQVISGVAVFGTADPRSSPAVVLYTPDAPDNLSFRELATIDDLKLIYRNPAWKDYFSERMATADNAEITRILSGRVSTAGRAVIKPIQGEFFKEMYRASVGFLVARAQHRSTTTSQVASRSILNQSLAAYELVTTLLSLLQVGAPTGAARGGIAGLVRQRQPASAIFRPPAITGASGRTPGIGYKAPLGWSLNDPAVIDRLRKGNRGTGGIQYQRDPATGKEYINIDGKYYRGEYRAGNHVIFDDKNVSDTRVIRNRLGGIFVQPRATGLKGGGGFWRTFRPRKTPQEAQRIAQEKSKRLSIQGNTGIKDVRGNEINETATYRGYVFRGDMRGHGEIFRDGFKLRVPVKNLKEVSGHRGGFGGGHDALDPDGRGISTSAFYSKDNAGAFYYGGAKGGSTYLIDARQMVGFDLYANNNLARNPGSTLKLPPLEINYAQDIPGSLVMGAFDADGTFMANPLYKASRVPIPLPPEAMIPSATGN